MRRLFFFIFSVLFLITAIQSQGEENRVVVSPEDNGQTLQNPDMGWTCHFYSNIPENYGSKLAPSDTLEYFEGASTVYLRIPWAFIEPEEGKFNWAILDTPAQRWIAKKKQVGFRFTTSENWLKYATPKWVFDAGAKGMPYTFGKGPDPDGGLIDPVFDDPIYLEKLENFLAAAGARYDGNPNIAFIDVGTFGLWGEGHTCFTSKLSDKENMRMAKIHIDLHRKYFPRTQLLMIDDTIGPESRKFPPLLDYCVQNGIGFRDDSILVQPPPKSWFHDAQAQKFWPTVPVFLEHEHYGGSKDRGAWDGELLIKAVEDYHATWLSIHWWPDVEWKECQETIRKINLRLGYRIRLKRIDYPALVKIGEEFDVTTFWENAGAAPCYRGGFMTLTLKDLEGGIVAVLADESMNVKDLEVGPPDAIPTTEHVSHFRVGHIAPVTKPGVYDLFISVGERDGTPKLALPMGEDDGQRRYKIGSIELTN